MDFQSGHPLETSQKEMSRFFQTSFVSDSLPRIHPGKQSSTGSSHGKASQGSQEVAGSNGWCSTHGPCNGHVAPMAHGPCNSQCSRATALIGKLQADHSSFFCTATDQKHRHAHTPFQNIKHSLLLWKAFAVIFLVLQI